MRIIPAIAFVVACGTSPDADHVSTHSGPVVDSLTLLYQRRVDGEIEPCG